VNTRESEGAVRRRLSARASHPKARSHNPITAPERLKWPPVPLPAYTQRHQISRVMGFAEVKEEAAQRAGDTQQRALPG